ncbi:MAG TPA: lipase maturation factor family protein [Myxococcota bacterium]|nr:lipase maturation factor family protein [Myxococcota bacterium]
MPPQGVICLAPKFEAPRAAPSWWLTRFAILRLLGAVYAVAFLAAALQLVPLIGEHGLLPLGTFLARVREHTGSPASAFAAVPSLFWLWHSDLALRAVAWTGFTLACVTAAGFANALSMALLWLLYSSIVHAGQEWYGYGWEIQLLETGFLAIFLCPLLDARPFPRRPPPVVVLFLFRWLIFRIMLGAGLIKLRGDPAWRDLTALFYHFETQPLPNPLSRGFHFLPKAILRTGVAFNHVAELVAPWLALGPRVFRRVGGALIVAFQSVLILSGNLSFLNWLTIVPALACFDDAVWSRILPRALVARAERAGASAVPSVAMTRLSWALAALVALLSIGPVLNMASSRQIMNTSFDPLAIVNTYGAFGTVGRERLTVVFEGTDAETADDTAVWEPYLYVAQPVDVARRPRQIAPYQPRLDWAMWFAAMGSPSQYPWTLHVVWKLLHGDPGMLSLFGDDPFPDHPPRFVRATLYRYAFAPPGNADGVIWTREALGPWLPPLSQDDPRLVGFLSEEGWLDEAPPE